MSAHPDPLHDAEATALARTAVRLSRGIAATWWITVGGILGCVVLGLGVWSTALLSAGYSVGALVTIGVGGLLWVLGMVPPLLDYRASPDLPRASRWQRIALPLLVAAAFGVAAWLVSGFWIFAALPLTVTIQLLKWDRDIRGRLLAAATLLLGLLWIIDGRFNFPPTGGNWFLLGLYSVVLPAVTVFSLWWWDVLVVLDRARASESRLGATQERLRVATDVHDLQGHHLQVIALQLELADRLMATDVEAGREQLKAARASVDEARQGTRDLATRFRSVPLSDEIANAVDLLRAAGVAAEATVDARADLAPAQVLGPVIRETTTNVLRHGGGRHAKLTLSRHEALWRFEITNDADHEAPSSDAGSGLEGIGRRAAEAGGTLDVQRGGKSFTVVVTVPEHVPEVSR